MIVESTSGDEDDLESFRLSLLVIMEHVTSLSLIALKVYEVIKESNQNI